MYIDRLRIQNIRGFGSEQFDLSFDRGDGSYAGWTVFAGRNGSGKTTLLRAMALGIVGPRWADRLQESFQGWVNTSETSALLTIELTQHGRDKIAPRTRRSNQLKATLVWLATKDGREPDLNHEATRDVGRGPWWEKGTGWFVAGYGNVRRLSSQSSDVQRMMARSPQASRLATLFRDDASLLEGPEWLRDLRLREADGNAKATVLLKTVFALLNHGLLPEHGDEVVRYDADGLWVATSRGGTRPVGDLSDGYRAVIALVLDLVRALYQAYGDIPMIGNSVDLPGVVLIDEVDAHLHVSWQQRIGFWAMRLRSRSVGSARFVG